MAKERKNERGKVGFFLKKSSTTVVKIQFFTNQNHET
jgi:hypothetical protein